MPESKKVVIKVEINGDKDRKKVLKAVSSFSGIESIALDMTDKKLTVIGNIDPVIIVGKLRKTWCTEIVNVGPAEDDEKNDDLEATLKAYKAYGYNPCIVPQYYYVHSKEENPNACIIT